MKEKTCCFTGHRIIRKDHAAHLAEITEQTIRELIARGYCYFGVGGALGFDTLAAKTVLRLKEEFPQVRLVLVIPCRDQAARWRAEDQAVYEAIKAQADKCVCLSERYYNGCMQARNRRLVDESSVCVCYLVDEKSGTGGTVRYAEQSGLEIIRLAEKCSQL